MMRVAATIIILFSMTQSYNAQEVNDWHWVNEHYYSILNTLLPMEGTRGTSIGFRSHQDLYTEVLEYSLLFSKDITNQQIEVVVRTADSTSIYDQIVKLHRQKPAASISEILPNLKIREWRLSDKICPDVKLSFEKFHHLKFTTPDPNLLILHPTIYEFQANASAGQMRLTLFDDTHPVVVWALTTRQYLEGCLKTAPSKK